MHFTIGATGYSARLFMKKISILLSALIIGAAGYLIYTKRSFNVVKQPSTFNAQPATTKPVRDTLQADTLTINAVGDVMFGSNYPDLKDFPPDSGRHLLKEFSPFLRDGDITFGNVEGVFLDRGGTPKGSGGQVFSFRQPVRMAEYYKENGFNLLSVANNHMADFGPDGIASTDSTLARLGLSFAGSLSRPTSSLTVKGIKIGFAAFAPHKGCADLNDISAAVNTVKKLKAENDIVIVSFHGGAEGSKAQHVTRRTEIFYYQNRGNVYAFTHALIDAGADVAIGHGPHVVRAMELYKGKLIAYSLGNFCTYGKFSLNGMSSNAPLLKFSIDQKGNFLKGQIISGVQYGEGGPVLDEDNKAAFQRIKELSAADFPESPLVFSNGKISKQ